MRKVFAAVLLLAAIGLRIGPALAQTREEWEDHYEDEKARATAGDPVAQLHMGIFLEGRVPRTNAPGDSIAAMQWYEKAARQGYRPAEIELAYFYRRGAPGLDKEPGRALYWHLRSTEFHGTASEFAYAVLTIVLGTLPFLVIVRTRRKALLTWWNADKSLHPRFDFGLIALLLTLGLAGIMTPRWYWASVWGGLQFAVALAAFVALAFPKRHKPDDWHTSATGEQYPITRKAAGYVEFSPSTRAQRVMSWVRSRKGPRRAVFLIPVVWIVFWRLMDDEDLAIEFYYVMTIIFGLLNVVVAYAYVMTWREREDFGQTFEPAPLPPPDEQPLRTPPPRDEPGDGKIS
jgi:hypothetical protein